MRFKISDWIKKDAEGQWWKRDTWTHFPHTGWIGVNGFEAFIERINFKITGKKWLENDWARYIKRHQSYKNGEIKTPQF